MIDSQTLHQSVLLEEAISALDIQPEGLYLDGTFGRGGHSGEILKNLTSGHLYSFDKDPEAIAFGEQQFAGVSQLSLIAHDFENISTIAKQENIYGKLNGILLDLGVSSPQLDNAERGFSFMRSGPLDMRMNSNAGMSAQEWIATTEEQEIARVLWEFGEERFSRKIAKTIVLEREKNVIDNTLQLAELIASVVYKTEKHKHPATRSFQAIRIHVNNELGGLQSALEQALDSLAIGGRLVCISFHSLEDRIVKRFFQLHGKPQAVNRHLPPVEEEALRLSILGKPVKAGAQELAANPRARSAVMRVATKVAI